jgi:hypothetical protein
VTGPDRASAEVMGINLMDRSRAEQTLSAGYQQGLSFS